MIYLYSWLWSLPTDDGTTKIGVLMNRPELKPIERESIDYCVGFSDAVWGLDPERADTKYLRGFNDAKQSTKKAKACIEGGKENHEQ